MTLKIMRPTAVMPGDEPRDGYYPGLQSGNECRFEAPPNHGADKSATYILTTKNGLRGIKCRVSVSVKNGVATSSSD